MQNLNRLVAWCKREWPTILVIAIGTLIQLYLVTRPFDFLLNQLIHDDSFFIFKVAANVAQGLGSTFDGVNPTNGYHPLWVIVLIGLYKFFGTGMVGDVGPIKIALLISVVLNTATAFFVARIFTRFTQSPWIRSFGMVVWLLNPFFLYEMLNGIETSPALLFFSILCLLALRLEERTSRGDGRASSGAGAYFFIGVIGGLMVLTRLDMGFYVFALLVWILIRQGLGGWRNAFWVCVGGLPVAVWFVWNYLTYHMFFTSASIVETLMDHTLIVQDHGTSWLQTFKAVIYSTQYIADHAFRLTGMYTLGSAFIGALAILAVMGTITIPRRLKETPAIYALFGGFALLFLANASVRWSYRSWYFVSGELFLAIVVCVVCTDLFKHVKHVAYKRLIALVLLCLTLFSFYVNWSKELRGNNNGHSTQYQLVETTEWMNKNLPPHSIIGTFSPGIQGYFSQHTLIDLDGWINNSAVVAMQKHQLWQYILDQHIAYISDYGPALSYRYKSFLGIDNPFERMTLIEDMYHDPQGIRIYKVKY